MRICLCSYNHYNIVNSLLPVVTHFHPIPKESVIFALLNKIERSSVITVQFLTFHIYKVGLLKRVVKSCLTNHLTSLPTNY